MLLTGVPTPCVVICDHDCGRSSSSKAILLPGEELRQAAQVAITARKDYGAVPKGQPLAKSHERALSEAAAAHAAAASMADSASLSDDDALPEEDDWGIESAPGPELPFSMPNGRTVHTGPRSAHGTFTASKLKPKEQLNSGDAKPRSGFSTLEHSMPNSAVLQTVTHVPTSNHQVQRQGFGQSETSLDTLDHSHASRTPISTAAQPLSQMMATSLRTSDHSALPALCKDSERQEVQGFRAVRTSHKPLAGRIDSRQVQQEPELSHSMDPSNTDEMLGIGLPVQHSACSQPDASQLADEKHTEEPNGSDTLQHSECGPGPPGVTVSRPFEGNEVQAQNHDRHSSASSEGSRLTELQKLQALSDASKQQAPRWLGSGPEDLSADLRLAQKLQQEELRWHQVHSRADTAKRKLKKESTLDAFFKRPAR